jgi:hypothetical protein
MSNKPNGGPAFPATAEHGLNSGEPGMTLREYYAGKALQGFCANPNCDPTTQEHFDNLAKDARCAADTLLKELAK